MAVVPLGVRSVLSGMDVAARTAYLMAVVTPVERAAASSITNVPRSLASASAPPMTRGQPKVGYDLLLAMFHGHRPPEERHGPATHTGPGGTRGEK